MKYTLKLHKHRLRLMLKRDNICELCPGRKGFNGQIDVWIGDERGRIGRIYLRAWRCDTAKGPCIICQDFVGVENQCPCTLLGKEEALKRTLLKLEEDV